MIDIQVLLLALVSLGTRNSIGSNLVASSDNLNRLPPFTYPVHYSIRLEMNTDLVASDNYTGQVTITINVRFSTDLIVLHSDPGNAIQNIHLKWHTSGEPIGISKIEQETETQFLKIYIDQVLKPDEQYQLVIDFSGKLVRHDWKGFFKQSFMEILEGDTLLGERFYAMTVFEPTFARKAFPCYDEPLFKATFDIEVVCGRGYNVHSNADLLEVQEWDQDRKMVRFDRTPPMASYLVAFLVSTFDETVRDVDGVRIGMVTRRVDGRALDFAFDMTGKSLQALQDYTGQKYSLPKLYQVGIKGFYGGNENWGLILYNEKALIVDQQADNWDKLFSAKLISHEVAHQFFGNLVGLIWWNDLWMKEGFATFMSDKLTYQFLPEARGMIEFQYNLDTWAALDFDSSPLTHPISNNVEHPDELLSLYFGENKLIVYEKAARVIRMMEHALGPAVFQAGVQKYIASNQYATAQPYHLYSSLHDFAVTDSMLPQETNVTQIFHSWVSQAGHPIVYVQRINDSNKYRLTQRRFKSNPHDPDARWWIPIYYSSYDLDKDFEETPAFWLPGNTDSVIATIDGELPLVNTRSYGFYRVTYWQQGWKEIIDNWHRIAGPARAKLLDDAFGLLWDQEMTLEILVSMLAKLKEDSDPLPWMTAMADHNLWKLVRLSAAKTNLESAAKRLAERLTSDMLELFLNDSRIESREVQKLSIKWVCRFGMPACETIGRSLYDYNTCYRLLSPEYVQSLQCNVRSVELLLQAIDFGTCFQDQDVFRQFTNNVFQNFRCPEMLNLFTIVINGGVPYLEVLLVQMIAELDYLQYTLGNQRLLLFLEQVAVTVFDPYHEQLMLGFMEHLVVITKEQRIRIIHLMTVQLDSAARITRILTDAVLDDLLVTYNGNPAN